MPGISKRLAAGMAVAGLAATGAVALGTNAYADPSSSPSAAPSASGTAKPTQGTQAGHQRGGKGGSVGKAQGTVVTGDEAKKVTDAVVAKNAGVTITVVRKNPDGSYKAIGTKADGTKVRYDVSSDLATITEAAAPGRRGGGTRSQDTVVTGDEAKKVTDAVVAKNAGVTITVVRKDPDGSYDAVGTKPDGTKVKFDVSSDLTTITARTRR